MFGRSETAVTVQFRLAALALSVVPNTIANALSDASFDMLFLPVLCGSCLVASTRCAEDVAATRSGSPKRAARECQAIEPWEESNATTFADSSDRG